MIAVGLGFRKACEAATLVALVRRALDEAGPSVRPVVLATVAEKDRPALREAAAMLGLPVRILSKQAMADVEDRLTFRSERVRACLGIPSVAEAAALSAAGPGARLILPRIAVVDATCAVAASADEP
ncbi:MAG TPA: cobalamin biosynthesis protein [Lichenihabitans sp.]|nr:cobalamin biosynthesis protein [Lichenihabitans sp.]